MSGALSFHRHLCDAFKVNLPDFLSDSLADDRLHLLPACAQHPCPASGDTMRGHFSLLLFFLTLLFCFFVFSVSAFKHVNLIFPTFQRYFVHFCLHVLLLCVFLFFKKLVYFHFSRMLFTWIFLNCAQVLARRGMSPSQPLSTVPLQAAAERPEATLRLLIIAECAKFQPRGCEVTQERV